MAHESLAGNWISVSNENLPEMLEKLGAGFLAKKAAQHATTTQVISFDGLKMNITTTNGIKKKEKLVMLDGSEFNDEIFGKQLTATGSTSDGVITVSAKLGGLDVTSVRKLNEEGQMVLTTTAGDVVCTRIFKRQ